MEEATSLSDTEVVGNIDTLIQLALESTCFESWSIASIATCKLDSELFLELPVNMRATILQMLIPVVPVMVSMWPDDSIVIAHTQYGR
eukprot:984210-Rhodomonas_salina.1